MGRNPFQVRNPVLDAVRGYDMVDNIMTRKENLQTAKEDRTRRIAREDVLDQRQGMQWNQQQEDRALSLNRVAKTEKRADDKYDEQKLFRTLSGQQAALDDVLARATVDATTPEERGKLRSDAVSSWADSLPEGDQKLFYDTLGSSTAFGTPEAAQRTRQSVSDLHGAVQVLARGTDPAAKVQAKAQALESINVLYADQINKGKAGRGIVGQANKRITDATFTKEGIVFTLGISGKDKDGKPVEYEEVITEHRGSDPKERVRAYRLDSFLRQADKMGTLADVMLRRRALLGAPAAIKRLNAKGAVRTKTAKVEKAAKQKLQALVGMGSQLGANVSNLSKQALAGVKSGKYSSYVEALSAHSELLKIAGGMDKESAKGTSGGSMPAEAKLIDYYMAKGGMTFDQAKNEAKKAKANPQKFAGDLYKSLLKIESEKLSDEPRRSSAELRRQAEEDAAYFFGGRDKGVAGGKSTGPGLVLQSSHGPDGGGMQPPAVEPRSGSMSAKFNKDKVTVNGKSYPVVNGQVIVDGKRYRVDKVSR